MRLLTETDTKIFQHETMEAVTPNKSKVLTDVIMHFFCKFCEGGGVTNLVLMKTKCFIYGVI